MAKAGQGSGRAAETQQSSDTSSVKTAGRGNSGGPNVSVSGPGMGAGFPGGMGSIGGIGSTGGIGGNASGPPPGTKAGSGSKSGGTQGAGQGDGQGVGPDGVPGTPDDTTPGAGAGDKPAGAGGAGSGTPTPDASGGVSGSGGSGAAAETLPADIPRESAGEDQVARQLREAAMAEKDPAIRDALWNEYRKVMGMKTK